MLKDRQHQWLHTAGTAQELLNGLHEAAIQGLPARKNKQHSRKNATAAAPVAGVEQNPFDSPWTCSALFGCTLGSGCLLGQSLLDLKKLLNVALAIVSSQVPHDFNPQMRPVQSTTNHTLCFQNSIVLRPRRRVC